MMSKDKQRRGTGPQSVLPRNVNERLFFETCSLNLGAAQHRTKTTVACCKQFKQVFKILMATP